MKTEERRKKTEDRRMEKKEEGRRRKKKEEEGRKKKEERRKKKEERMKKEEGRRMGKERGNHRPAGRIGAKKRVSILKSGQEKGPIFEKRTNSRNKFGVAKSDLKTARFYPRRRRPHQTAENIPFQAAAGENFRRRTVHSVDILAILSPDSDSQEQRKNRSAAFRDTPKIQILPLRGAI